MANDYLPRPAAGWVPGEEWRNRTFAGRAAARRNPELARTPADLLTGEVQ